MSDTKTTAFYAALDAGVAPVVRLLRDHGWNTNYSCEGGPGHSHVSPTVELEIGKLGDLEDIASLLVEHGYPILKIEASLHVPREGFWRRRAAVTLGEWR